MNYQSMPALSVLKCAICCRYFKIYNHHCNNNAAHITHIKREREREREREVERSVFK